MSGRYFKRHEDINATTANRKGQQKVTLESMRERKDGEVALYLQILDTKWEQDTNRR